MLQLAYPGNRAEVDDFAGVARALAHEARRYALPIPAWLAAIAGYPKPPPVLRVVDGGKRDDGIGERQIPRVR